MRDYRDQPAYPFDERTAYNEEPQLCMQNEGLTKYDYFLGHVIQGLLSNGMFQRADKLDVAARAVEITTELCSFMENRNNLNPDKNV